MADNNNNHNDDEVSVVPGTPEFEKMLFKLNKPVTDDNLGDLDYNEGRLQAVQDGLYAMPAYVTDDFNLFFIVSQLVEDDWVIAFSHATIENDHEITDLSEPMTTGKGLNELGEKSPADANKLLKYFNTLAEANRGEWRMVERPDGAED
ncbi:hypothetical protein [Lentilactobacillus farraginis]|uniref:Uncharacterized protein n=1 Tax=Lentilactobacillus farraginis DSM 18382 = JCM 14108 TaxID=1423743 RepID=X0PEM8_9LACO|nr:hypothetical protein [Lentilactobacillus farraginis]KRM10001.1 hypothetical protein FD41_GL002183 [Lentilactobacillus farraginis DSM 18382 = JCM 14108]GAF35147.1 hypothetical protein JCM14108_22 [Lentilactobacillus farraginis DSM 18382 = JCM 14108]